MKGLVQKYTAKAYEKLVNKLVEEWIQAGNSIVLRSLISMKANGLKDKCAELAIEGKMDYEDYVKIFKVGQTDMYNHFLKILAEEKNA